MPSIDIATLIPDMPAEVAQELIDIVAAQDREADLESQLWQAQTEVDAAVQRYHEARLHLLLRKFDQAGLEWCSFKEHAAPKGSVALIYASSSEAESVHRDVPLGRILGACTECKEAAFNQSGEKSRLYRTIKEEDGKLLAFLRGYWCDITDATRLDQLSSHKIPVKIAEQWGLPERFHGLSRHSLSFGGHYN